MDCSPPGSSVHGIFQARVLKAQVQYLEFFCLIIKTSQGTIPSLVEKKKYSNRNSHISGIKETEEKKAERQGKGEAGRNRKCYQKSKLEWVYLGIKASKDRKKKISDVQAKGRVKSEKNVIYQGGMKDVRGSFQAPERVEERTEKCLTPRASAGHDGTIIGSRDSQGWVGPRRRCPARLKPGAAGEVGETARGLGFSGGRN